MTTRLSLMQWLFSTATWLICLAFGVSLAQAQFVVYGTTSDAPTVYTFSVSPRSPQPPTMKHRLFPTHAERFPGNAAPLYHRAILLISQNNVRLESPTEHWQKVDNWRTLPLEEFPIEEVERFLEMYTPSLQETSFGARREYCDWGLPTRENGEDILAVLLPEIQEMRTVARLLALRIRLRLAQGRLDEAVADLQTGYAVARHVGNRDFIVNALVGFSIESLMHEQLMTAISLEETPNLYWSIVNQPTPLIDIRNAIDVEIENFKSVFPELIEAQKDIGDRVYWDRKLLDVIDRVQRFKSNSGYPSGNESTSDFNWEATAWQGMVYSQVDRIKKELIEDLKFDRDMIEAMPGSRAILFYSYHNYPRVRDTYLAPLGLPYAQAKKFYPGNDFFSLDPTVGDPLGIPQLLLPATGSFQRASVHAKRWHAMLLALEAIRDYAAKQGQLPKTLAEVDHLPVPNNPFDDQPFRYVRDEQKPSQATLEGVGAPGAPIQIRFTVR